MLASITPLGERSRGFSWRVTAGAFAVGAILAGAAAGAALGALGAAVLPGSRSARAVALVAVLALTALLDATPLGRWLPSSHRQVNEQWLNRYRGWVYGLAFGAQLGVGVVTVVTSAAVYATGVCALLCPGAAAGALVGGCFGAVRALSLLPARAARDPESLVSLHRRGLALEAPTRTAVAGLELVLFLAVAAAVIL